MGSRYYRHLFQCQGNVIVQSGSIVNSTDEQGTTYVYLTGFYHRESSQTDDFQQKQQLREEKFPLEDGTVLDICVLGVYTYATIIALLHILKKYPTCTVLLPYITPLQRLHLAGNIPIDHPHRRELIYFLDYPYESLRKTGTENIYFLCGNGEPIRDELDYLEEGYHFTMENDELTKLICGMEGQTIPVLKSGYIRENDWIFYFGTFGTNVLRIKAFMRQYAEKNKSQAGSDYQRLQEMLRLFERQFGSSPYPSILLYHGPVWDSPTEYSSLMTGRAFPAERGCRAGLSQKGIDCALKCQHDNDYECMQYHRNKNRNRSRMGIWHLGNINLKEYLPQILLYFEKVTAKTRALTIPECGSRELWNPQILKQFLGQESIYWITSAENCQNPEQLIEILTKQGHNRLININDEFGYCFSGYLISNDGL